MVERSRWLEITQNDPEHSARYVERFRVKAAAGDDLAGEARLVDAMAPRAARVLDAGCGPGRVGGALARRGHHVVGVDIDPVLIAAAQDDHPDAQWRVADLAELDLASEGITGDFDVIVSAGNVMAFLAPSTRREVLVRMRRHLAPGGRIVVGFGSSGHEYPFDRFFTDVGRAALSVDLCLSTWDLRPFTDDAAFLVAVLSQP